jgi:diguanylate cyclase (GGDEF)-like protein
MLWNVIIDGALSFASFGGVLAALAAASLIGLFAFRRLREQKLCLDTAVDNMCQGLTMFDRSGRLILCNRRYIEMYGLDPEVIKPGCTVRQVIEHRIATGSLAPSEAEKYANLRDAAVVPEKAVTSKAVTNIVELANRRTIVVTRRSMPGGGWVATHEDVTERRQSESKIAHMAHHDALTDLPNRILLRDRLEAALVRVRRGEQLAVLYLDLDHFKSTNDSLGHAVGDELLKAVAGRLRACLRETDTIARLGGDEFAVIQTAIDGPSHVAALARRVRDALTAPYQLADHQILADVSIGISIAPNDGTASDQLLKQADMALYRAKSDGRGTFRFFEAEMDARVKARRMIELDLRKALANEELELYYQPLVNLERNAVSGCEALLRWHHPERGMISPAEFIPIAEETGLIVKIGEWVLRRACAEAATWPDDVTVAVNVSPIQFREPTLVLTVVNALAQAGLSPRRLEIEITEAVLLRDNDATLASLHQLRELGVRVVMDDFGTGYSSLSYLRSFPFDKIKIDRSFIKDLSDESDAGAIVQAITGLASSLNITTTAEGAETQAQMDRIRSLGCTEMQGYLFSRPKSAKDIAHLFRARAAAAASAA